MEIIIHGKPNAGSSKATPSIESTLYQRIVDEYFQSMSQLKISDALIVDARYWKNVWYSVYTYWLGTNVKDTADRDSFLAISIVVPKQYYCLVSEVYKHLKRVCETFVIGHYLSGNGKYLIQNFEDDTLFKILIAKINDGFVNLLENFDDSFRPQSALNNNDFYNVVDCDSKAFVDVLKLKGRIIVTETASTKDAFIINASKTIKQAEEQKNQHIQKTKEQQTELEAKTQTIARLENEIADLKKQVANSTNSTQQKIRDLERQISLLHREKNDIITKYQTIATQKESLSKKLAEIATIIGRIATPVQTPQPPTTKKKGWQKYIPFLNSFLIIIVGCLLFFNPKTKSDDKSEKTIATLQNDVKEKKKTITQLQASVTSFKSQIAGLNKQISELQTALAQSQKTSTQTTNTTSSKKSETDIDCKIAIFQESRPIDSPDSVDLTKPILIKVKEQTGYKFCVSNIKDENGVRQALEQGKEVLITKADPTKPVVITYRTNNRNNLNPNNKLTFK